MASDSFDQTVEEFHAGRFPKSMLNETGQYHEAKCVRIGKLYRAGRFEATNECSLSLATEANGTCQWLLNQPSLSMWHRAYAHRILSYSPHNYVHHAREALRLYQAMPVDEDDATMKAVKDRMINNAQKSLDRALSDQAELTETVEVEYTLQELVDLYEAEEMGLAEESPDDQVDDSSDEEATDGNVVEEEIVWKEPDSESEGESAAEEE